MSGGRELKSPGAMALRAAGYKPCPRWWLTEEQMELVAYMASQNSAEVNRIRSKAAMPNEERKAADLDAAWKNRKNGAKND
jgi:hypothetical protein